jgi:DNA-binding winged helix-turn-helix (wHTH) protein
VAATGYPQVSDRNFCFGPFELSEREGELRKNGIRLKLQEQPFRVLLELVANAGKVVSREGLQQKLWPADTFVDFDTGLNTAIRKLRQALNDDPDEPRYIETLARRGYRFIAPVAVISPTPTSKVNSTLPEPNAAPAPEPFTSPPRAAESVSTLHRYR